MSTKKKTSKKTKAVKKTSSKKFTAKKMTAEVQPLSTIESRVLSCYSKRELIKYLSSLLEDQNNWSRTDISEEERFAKRFKMKPESSLIKGREKDINARQKVIDMLAKINNTLDDEKVFGW